MDSKTINIDSRFFVALVNVANIFGLTIGNTEDVERNDIVNGIVNLRHLLFM